MRDGETVWAHADGAAFEIGILDREELLARALAERERAGKPASPELRAPMPGTVVAVHVADMPVLMTDAVALEQIFSNLLDNAVKYLTGERDGEIEIGCRETARDHIFYLRDNGRGIDTADSDRVFNIFRRARNAGDVRGLGIGMAYVKASLRKMSGSIWFESALGVGTTFYVSLPKKPLRTEAETPDLEEADA